MDTINHILHTIYNKRSNIKTASSAHFMLNIQLSTILKRLLFRDDLLRDVSRVYIK